MPIYETPVDIPGRIVLLASARDWLEVADTPNLDAPIVRLIRDTINGLEPAYALRITFLPDDARKVLRASVGEYGDPAPPTMEAFVHPNGTIGIRPSRQG